MLHWDHLVDAYHSLRWFFDREGWRYVRSFKVGDLIQDCRYHPCVIIDNSQDGDIEVFSLIAGSTGFCSLYHCGVRHLTPEEVYRHLKAFGDGGEKGLLMANGWTEAEYDEFSAKWR